MYMSRAFFFFNDTATTEIYTLSLHDALPICEIDLRQRAVDLRGELPHDHGGLAGLGRGDDDHPVFDVPFELALGDRKSTRLNSSHANISYAVFCLKKKKNIRRTVLHQLACTQ